MFIAQDMAGKTLSSSSISEIAEGISFRASFMESCSFSGVDIKDCDFSLASMSYTYFKYCLLDGVNLFHTDLQESHFDGVNFMGCTIIGTHFKDAVFENCRFENCKILGANFRYTDFDEECVFDGGVLSGVFVGARMPDRLTISAETRIKKMYFGKESK